MSQLIRTSSKYFWMSETQKMLAQICLVSNFYDILEDVLLSKDITNL